MLDLFEYGRSQEELSKNLQRLEELLAEYEDAKKGKAQRATHTKHQELDIQTIIDDAMKNKDRYVSIFVTNEGHMSVNVYPHDEEELCWIRDEETDTFICPSCGRPSVRQTIYCPICGEKVKKNT